MSRGVSWIGLTEKAKVFLGANRATKLSSVECPHCHWVVSVSVELEPVREYTKEDIFYGQEYPLLEYKLNDDKVAREVIQESPWSSGPVIFTCLEIDGKKQFKWEEKEIEDYL